MCFLQLHGWMALSPLGTSAAAGWYRIDADAYKSQALAGVMPGLGFVGDALLTGGGTGGQMALRALSAGGYIATPTALGSSTVFSGQLGQIINLTAADGGTHTYGAISGRGGIAQMSFSAAGSLTGTATIAAPTVADLASAQIGTSSYVFSVFQDNNTLTSWTVAANGRLTAAHSLTPETGLWISAPTALTTAQVDGQTYVILGSAGSDSLSVMAVGAGGTLTITDHLLDDRNSRFGGVAALDVVTVGGHSYVISGGDDDGISIHLLLPGGQLLA